MNTKKKLVKEGLRNIGNNLVKEQEIEKNLYYEISKEIHQDKKKQTNK